MTGINLNVQNSYAALYSASQTQTENSAGSASITKPTIAAASLGEKLTLSAEAIALSLQTSSPIPTEETPLGGGPGVRPPSDSHFGGGPGVRPPSDSQFGGGPGVRPPA
jgi:hypothetical protein